MIRFTLVFSTCIFLLAFSSCVGGTFGNHEDIEEYPLRAATKEEAKNLKRCLQEAHESQVKQKKNTGAYYLKIREMPIDGSCQGFQLAMKSRSSGYEIVARFHENETTVQWTINQDGVIEEYLDPSTDQDWSFDD